MKGKYKFNTGIGPSLIGFIFSTGVISILFYRLADIQPMCSEIPVLYFFLSGLSLVVMLLYIIGAIIFSVIIYQGVRDYLRGIK